MPECLAAVGGSPQSESEHRLTRCEEEVALLAAEQFSVYASLPNYLRLLERGGVSAPAEAAIIGNESSVAGQITALFDAGATDVWAAPFGVGADPAASRARTRSLLKELVTQ